MNLDDLVARITGSTPIPNSYWVAPGRLLAGEYPAGMTMDDTQQRLRRLVKAGITSFIDLTQQDELAPYAPLLEEMGRAVAYQRFPIEDHGLPSSPQALASILDALDAELAAGRSVYVHCRAGIGRTGMVIACHLMRQGRTNEAALAHLQKLWQQCARSRNWPTVPETPEQVAFVRHWRDPRTPAANSGDVVVEAALLGMAIGDALGAPGSFNSATLKPGASTAQMQLAAESLLECKGHDASDQMQRYVQWMRSTRLPVPPELKRVLGTYQWSKKPNAGSHDPKNLDAHTLPRTLAAAMYERTNVARAVELGVELSRTTQQSPVVLDVCRLWTALFSDALAGLSKPQLLAASGPAMRLVCERQLKPPLRALIEQRWRNAPTTQVATDVLTVTGFVMTVFANSQTFAEGMRVISNRMPEGAPVVGALYGALAATCYGLQTLPAEWRNTLVDSEPLRTLAQRFTK